MYQAGKMEAQATGLWSRVDGQIVLPVATCHDHNEDLPPSVNLTGTPLWARTHLMHGVMLPTRRGLTVNL